MIQTLVTGATGTLGTALRPRLATAGHAVRAASRSPPDPSEHTINWVELDLLDDTGLTAALEDIDVVVHTATAPRGDTAAVDVQGTRQLLKTAEAAGVEHFLYPSIVGIDDIPFSYYEHKVAAETAVEDSNIPTTIVRATQFYSFVRELLDDVAKLPVWPLPTEMQIQPIHVGDVADVIVNHATLTASGRIDPIGGPEVHSVGELARAYRAARGLRRLIVRFPIPGDTVAAFRTGHATCPDHRVGTVTWEEWLSEQYRSDKNTPTSRVPSSM